MLLSCLTEKNQQWARLAPVLMVSVAKLNFDHTGKPNRHAFYDVGMAAGNLMLQATALNLFVHQMAGFLKEKVAELYSIPDGFEPVAAIALGYAGELDRLPEQFRPQELAPRSRKLIQSFVFAGQWVSPLRWFTRSSREFALRVVSEARGSGRARLASNRGRRLMSPR
jgi:hypothetical protein